MKDTNMSNQDVVDRNTKRFAVAEGNMRGILIDMLEADRPFGDAECNDEFEVQTEEAAMLYFGMKRLHRGVTACIKAGDPTVQIGGK